jgi:hypothetical protein
MVISFIMHLKRLGGAEIFLTAIFEIGISDTKHNKGAAV